MEAIKIDGEAFPQQEPVLTDEVWTAEPEDQTRQRLERMIEQHNVVLMAGTVYREAFRMLTAEREAWIREKGALEQERDRATAAAGNWTTQAGHWYTEYQKMAKRAEDAEAVRDSKGYDLGRQLEASTREVHRLTEELAEKEDSLRQALEQIETFNTVGKGGSSGDDKGPKIAPPETFGGDRDKAEEFLMEVGMYIRAKPGGFTTDLKKGMFLISYMKGGTAGMWAKARAKELEKDPRKAPLTSWKETVRLFEDAFFDANRKQTA